jgi:hypothetical protein
MKLLTTIFLLLSITCFSQSDTASRSEKIKLTFNYNVLANFDFENELKLDYLHSSQIRQPQSKSSNIPEQLLCGGWQAESLKDNWYGSLQTLVKPDKRIIFQKDSIFFYHNDTLTRASAYRIVRTSIDSGHYQQTLLVLSDSGEKWRLYLYQVGEYVPWHGTARRLYLLFNKELNCACGCLEELYSQEIPFQASNF